jgi:hypothetical protein
MNEGTRSGKSTIRLLGISAERPTNGLYLYLLPFISDYGNLKDFIDDRNVMIFYVSCYFQEVIRRLYCGCAKIDTFRCLVYFIVLE